MKRIYLIAVISLIFSSLQISAQCKSARSEDVKVLKFREPRSWMPALGRRAMIDWSYQAFNVDAPGDADILGTTELSAFSLTLGQQVSRNWFFGLGFQAAKVKTQGAYGGQNWLSPVYLDARCDLDVNGVDLYGDLRGGYIFTGSEGMYFAPTIGWRCPMTRGIAFNIGLGMQMYAPYMEKFTTVGKGDNMVVNSEGWKHRAVWTRSFTIGLDF